jgi:hypothetical protein
MILVSGVALSAGAQGTRLTDPIEKARAAKAASDARLDTAQAVVKETPVKRDSTGPKAPSSGKSTPPTVAAKPTASSTANPPAGAKPAPATNGARPADSAKAPAAGKTPATPASGSEKGAVPTPAQVTPGKSPSTGGKAPTVPAPNTPTTGKATPGVTAPGGKPSPMVEAAPTDVTQPTTVGSTGTNRPELRIDREVFQYDQAGRRDPFESLLATSDLRPMFNDLLLVVINYDPQGRNSVAIMRDTTTKEQYRARQGQLIGRMRVAAIEPKRVTFTIDEFGFSRQESLVIGDTTKVRKQ